MMNLNDGSYAFCSFHRGTNEDHVQQPALEEASFILPHLRRSLQLRRRLLKVEATGQAVLDLLDHLAQAVVLIDEQGTVLWHNGAARTLIAQRDGLAIASNELRAEAPMANDELHRLIKTAITAVSVPTAQAGGMMTIMRPSLKRAFQILVTPLPRAPSVNLAATDLRRVPAVALFMIDPEVSPQPRAQMLAKLYDLTPAEARLASALAAGRSSKDYASEAGLSVNYVRWLVKQVQAKTDTRRLADLVRLLGTQIAFLRDDEDGA
jgi:DNA-binding CsgD family transcriptional regulator